MASVHKNTRPWANTATRDLSDLLAKSCLQSEGAGRGTRYVIKAKGA